jgi:hypothetical protein
MLVAARYAAAAGLLARRRQRLIEFQKGTAAREGEHFRGNSIQNCVPAVGAAGWGTDKAKNWLCQQMIQYD